MCENEEMHAKRRGSRCPMPSAVSKIKTQFKITEEGLRA